MIEKESQITEKYNLNHRHDSNLHRGFDYETNLFNKLLSNVMFGNDTLREFLLELQKNAVWMIESTLPVRNWFNYTVNRYYNKHNN